MAEPRAAIARHRRGGDPPRVTGDHRNDQADEHQQRTHEVQTAAGPITVLRQVKRIELSERGKLLGHRLLFERGVSGVIFAIGRAYFKPSRVA